MGKEQKEQKRLKALEDALMGDKELDDELSEIFDIEIKPSIKKSGEITAADSLEAGDEEFIKPRGEIIQLPLTRAPRKIYVSIAVIMLFFSVIGFISSVTFVINTATDIRERRALKEEFALFIYPVVINDPPAFDSVDNLLPQTIITSALWKIILTGDKSNYTTDIGVIYVPAADVELSARSIFGTGTLEHQSVSSHGTQFIYSEHGKNYEIPANPTLFSNSPLVTSVTNIGEMYTVTVDYIAPSPLSVAGIKHNSEPIKTMIYTISRTREKTTIDSIQATAFEHFRI